MKKPIKNPPVSQIETEDTTTVSPTIIVDNINNFSSSNTDETRPSIDPPAYSGASDEGFGAGVWNNDKRVNGLFTTNHVRNSWMSVVGTGWVKLANNIDSANVALNILAANAKIKNSSVNYLLDGGMATQIYVW